MNVLAIGNSFSEDAMRYLHDIAKADSFDITTVNLYIGGCPLSLHYKNILEDKKSYELQFNGAKTGFFVSVKEALLNRDWDFVVVQQVSSQSFEYDTYQPYLNELTAYIKRYAPKAKIAIHQTWAYEENSDLLCKNFGFGSHSEMFKKLESAYKNAADEISASLIIKSGELFYDFTKAGVKIHRDSLHATYGFGRYALGLLWYRTLTGNNVTDNTFSYTDEPLYDEDFVLIKSLVQKIKL